MMENLTRIGYTMLCHSECDILKAGAIVALQHHEKWNDSGYPQGLKGDETHIYGCIIALADVFDALTFRRVYKEPWEPLQVVERIKEQSGIHFDSVLIKILSRISTNFTRSPGNTRQTNKD